jgi:Rrf2 family protein
MVGIDAEDPMLPMKSRYALKALVFLARHQADGPVPVSVIAAEEAIPVKFLEAILLEMRNAGVLASRRGPTGGYQMRADPKDVHLGDVIRNLSGPMAPLPCLSKTAYHRCAECVDEATCSVRILMADVHAAQLRIVDGTTLAELVARVDASAAAEAERRSQRCRADNAAIDFSI